MGQWPDDDRRHELTHNQKRDPRGWFGTPRTDPTPDQPCPRCGVIGETKLSWQKFGNDSFHVRQNCSACGTYIQWVRQTPDVLKRVGEKPTAPEQGGLFR